MFLPKLHAKSNAKSVMILSNHGNVIRIGITYKEIPLQKFIERNSLQTKSRN